MVTVSGNWPRVDNFGIVNAARSLVNQVTPHAKRFSDVGSAPVISFGADVDGTEATQVAISESPTSPGNNSASKTVGFLGHQFMQGILPDVKAISAGLNGQATEEQRLLLNQFINTLDTKNGDVTGDEMLGLLVFAGEIILQAEESPETEDPRRRSSHAHDSRDRHDDEAEATSEKPNGKRTAADDGIGGDEGKLIDALRGVVLDSDSPYFGAVKGLAGAVGMDVENYVSKQIFNKDFAEALKASIQGSENKAGLVDKLVGADGYQKTIFRAIDWGLWGLSFMPEGLARNLPAITKRLVQANSFLVFVPGIGQFTTALAGILQTATGLIQGMRVGDVKEAYNNIKTGGQPQTEPKVATAAS